MNTGIYDLDVTLTTYFTEKLIEESIKNRLNVVVEGTMRNPKVPLQTAHLYKQAGF
jgi:hypothetical protein